MKRFNLSNGLSDTFQEPSSAAVKFLLHCTEGLLAVFETGVVQVVRLMRADVFVAEAYVCQLLDLQSLRPIASRPASPPGPGGIPSGVSDAILHGKMLFVAYHTFGRLEAIEVPTLELRRRWEGWLLQSDDAVDASADDHRRRRFPNRVHDGNARRSSPGHYGSSREGMGHQRAPSQAAG